MSVEVVTPVNVIKVPVVGERVWFVSEEEMMEGLWLDGVIFEVTLNTVKLHVSMSESDPEAVWVLPLSDPNFLIYFSYEDFLFAQCEKLLAENLRYRRKYGQI